MAWIHHQSVVEGLEGCKSNDENDVFIAESMHSPYGPASSPGRQDAPGEQAQHAAADQIGEQPEEEDAEDEGGVADFFSLMSDLELEECLRLILPIVKLDPNKYLIGTKVRQVQIKNDSLLARVGGGFMEMDQMLAQEAKIQCVQILMQMEKKEQTFQETMVEILEQKRADLNVINRFLRETKKVSIPFYELVNAVR